jgi:hypothetical protein
MESVLFSLMHEFGFTPQDIVISLLLFMNYRTNKQIFTSLCNRVLVLETVTGVKDNKKRL